MNFKHNKRRNSGLLYEFLLRRLSASFINENDSEIDRTLFLIKKHFHSKSVLSEELSLFNILLNNRTNNVSSANDILKEVTKCASNINEKRLNYAKGSLLRDIESTMSDDLFDSKLRNYKVYASIQQLFDLHRRQRLGLNESVRKIKLEERLAEYIINNKPEKEKVFEASKKYDKLVLKLFINGYNQKYGDKLTENQQLLMKNLVESCSEDFMTHIDNVISVVNDCVQAGKSKKVITENDVLNVKYTQLINKWNKHDKEKVSTKPISESSLATLMRYVGLIDEISS